ncbi:portal protein [Pandoraea sputorum]|uniref:portal protein n=1 Tax=Pandoraea sputorum TaxID=93222 RepID=UPI00124144A0|nr:portal protein [Pandoraea sputorum]VVE77407.1 phage head-tail adapter protein [Pandoraea sputorum]
MVSLRDHFDSRTTALELDRSTWDPHWRDICRFVEPRRGQWLFMGDQANDGRKRSNNIIDSTATFAARTLMSGLQSGVTSPSRPWLRLGTEDPYLKEYGPVKQWLAAVERLMYEAFRRSNLYHVLPRLYLELGVIGTGAMTVEEHPTRILQVSHHTVGSYYLGNGADGTADTLYRNFKMTARQMAQRFGKDSLSTTVRNLLDRNSDSYITVRSVIEPNSDRDPSQADNRNLRIRSVYYEEAGDREQYLEQSGYYEQPFMAPRWDTSGDDTYGQGPGMIALGDVKQLQDDQLKKAKALALQVEPPLVVNGMERGELSILPGAVSYSTSTDDKRTVYNAYQQNPDVNWVLEDIQEVQRRINTAFFVDLFQTIANMDRSPGAQITAFEIQERKSEAMLMLGPVLERLDNECLDPLVKRTYAILQRKGMLPPQPPELDNQALKIEYISILSQAQKASSVSVIDNVVANTFQLAQADPSAMDWLDTDQVVQTRTDLLGGPPEIMRSQQQVDAMRQRRQQQEQMQQMAANAPALADTAKTMSDTSLDGSNALTRILGIA